MQIKTTMPRGEPDYVLERIQRGLAGHISYLAACDMNATFNEYVLYEPILRILVSQGYKVECEYALPKDTPNKRGDFRGDYKRIDFVAFHDKVAFALEVKWINEKSVDLGSDVQKLNAFLDEEWLSFLCIFGRESDFEHFKIPEGFRQKGKFILANFFRTKYGCKIYQLMEHIPENAEAKIPVKVGEIEDMISEV